MEEQSMFNLYEQPKTNQDLTITFTPSSSVATYTYQIIRNNEVMNTITIDSNRPESIFLTETGTYSILVEEILHNGKKETVTSGLYQIDQEKPIIILSDTVLDYKIGTELNPMDGVRAYDETDGDLLGNVTTNLSELDLHQVGIQKLVYTVSDSSGNITSKTVNLNIMASESTSLFLIQSVIVLFVFIALILMMVYRKSVRLEKRLRVYALEPIKDNSLSVFDSVLMWYRAMIHKLNQGLNHSVFLKKYAKRYTKYGVLLTNYQEPMDFISMKLVVSLLFLAIAVISAAVQLQVPELHELILPIIAGFFAPDLLYIIKYKMHHERLENDLLQAIIIMNNAFKSGRSITQAIHLVTTELTGPIALEFEKMEMELALGLSVDVVFERFAERIQLDEVTYLTASLSILNRTGGNIIKVFDSIEESMFGRKKLKLELQSLTGGSKIIVFVLMIVPFLFVIFISFLNPDYFVPFLTTPFGIILLLGMLIYYVIYVIVVRKIMKVRM